MSYGLNIQSWTYMIRRIQHPKKQYLYDHLPPITQAIKKGEEDILDITGEAMTNS